MKNQVEKKILKRKNSPSAAKKKILNKRSCEKQGEKRRRLHYGRRKPNGKEEGVKKINISSGRGAKSQLWLSMTLELTFFVHGPRENGKGTTAQQGQKKKIYDAARGGGGNSMLRTFRGERNKEKVKKKRGGHRGDGITDLLSYPEKKK